MSLKDYISKSYQTIDDSIKHLTDIMDYVDTLKDGGTTIYKSNAYDVTIIKFIIAVAIGFIAKNKIIVIPINSCDSAVFIKINGSISKMANIPIITTIIFFFSMLTPLFFYLHNESLSKLIE